MRIIVSGQLANALNQGGAAWVVLQYILGLRALGHDVYFIEPLARSVMQPQDARLQHTLNAAYFERLMLDFGFSERSSLINLETRCTVGMDYGRVQQVCRESDLLLNLSGLLREPDLLKTIPVRAYVDIDPGFTQLWQASEGIDMGLQGHTHFLTIGEAIGSPGCDIPDCGKKWLTMRQPVFLREWPVLKEVERNAFTTVANWRAYGSIEFKGCFYGQKAHSLRTFIGLPRLCGERFELALTIHPDERRDLDSLKANSWELLDPVEHAGSPAQFRRFVQGSRAEFGIAKSGYVAGRTGWFSDRSACYLASGRPVLAQETGFSSHIPAGEGLLAFESTEDILEAADELRTNYARHAASARAIAEEYFDSDRVLNALLEKLSSGGYGGG